MPAPPSSPERIPPHSEEAEVAVLGSLLIDPQHTLDLCSEYSVGYGSFYVPAHRTVFRAALEMDRRGEIVDLATLTEELRKTRVLDSVGGTVVLQRLIDDTPTAAHVEHYIGRVAQQERLRAIIDQCRDTESACFEQADSAENIIAEFASSMSEIEDDHSLREIPWPETIKENLLQIEAIQNGTQTLGLQTGFYNIDRSLTGLQPKHLLILAARPSMGKTSLAMNIAENVALGKAHRDGIPQPVGVFSLEMSRTDLARRMLGAHAQVNMEAVTRGICSPQTHAKLTQAASVLTKAPIHCDDAAGLDVEQVRIRARRWKRKHNIQLLIVDYLQLLRCKADHHHSRQQEVSAISAQLKAIAKDLDVPVLALSQLSRNLEHSEKPRKPRLSDLRDSGAIEQDADEVLLLRRPCMYEGLEDSDDETLAICEIAKQRSGRTGDCRLNFVAEHTRFSDRATGVDGQQNEPWYGA